MKNWGLGIVAAAFATIAAPAAAAPVVGDALTCTASGLTCSAGTATMGSGVEFSGGAGLPMPLLSFDFSQGLLKITNAAGYNYGFSGKLNFAFSDSTHPFTEATLMANSGFTGVSQDDFSLANNVLTFSSKGFSAANGAGLTIRLNATGAVPEPASWAMMILGVGAIGFGLRRRRTTMVAGLA